MSRANTDLQQVQDFVVMIPLTISNAVTSPRVTVILFVIDPLLALLALGALPFLNVLAKRFSRRLHPAVIGIQQESAELAAVVEETVSGVRVVKGFGAEQVQAGRLRAEADDVYACRCEAARSGPRYLPALELLPNSGSIAVLGYGGHQVLDGQLSLGELVASTSTSCCSIWPLRMLGMIIAQAQRGRGRPSGSTRCSRTEPEIARPGSIPSLPAGRRHRSAPSASRRRRSATRGGRPVLDGFDLELVGRASRSRSSARPARARPRSPG